nr:MAG TPA: putative tail component [Caudoviricetes sp.]
MSDSIYFQNFDDFLRKLKALEADCERVARNVLNRAALEGMGETMKETPVDTGYLRGQWEPHPAKRTSSGWESGYSNNVEYGLYVNYGHRVVRNGKTVGYSTGFFMLEAGEEFAREHLKQYFDEEIANIKQGGGW